MDATDLSPVLIADAYRFGQIDGFKAGLVVGLGAVMLVKMASRRERNGRYWIWRKGNDT